MWDLLSDVASTATSIVFAIPRVFASADVQKEVIVKEMVPLSGRAFVRVAGLSGALAVSIGAYGAHGLKDLPDPERKYVFDTAYRMHLIHSVALLGVPITGKPALVGGLMTAGIVLFCGSCYYHAFTGKSHLRWVTPIGGTTIILAWLAMVL